MRIAVFGTGGVGGYFGGRLALSGQDVTFIARGNHIKALQAEGLRVDSLKGDFLLHPVRAISDPAEAADVDLVLLAVKAWQVPEAARVLSESMRKSTFVVPLQNGVEAASQLVEALGAERVVGGLCRIISYIEKPGYIRHVGAEPQVAFGELDNRPSERTEKLKQAFEQAGVSVQIPPNIQTAIWEKFLFIASVSGIGAVTRSPIGIVRTVWESRAMLEQAMAEIFHLAAALNISLPENTVERTMQFVDNLPANGTASMQRDIQDARPSELESQNGAVVRLGRQAGVETPIHRFIYHALLPTELKARGQITLPE
jgi:2-dehydropantoate 2-reductase